MNILHITGQQTSEKIGGLEKWYAFFVASANKNGWGEVFLIFSKETPKEPVAAFFVNNNVKTAVFDYRFSIANFLKFHSYLRRNQIQFLHCHFENTLWFLVAGKLLGMKTFWHLNMENYYSVNNDWKNNFKVRVGVTFYRLKIFMLQFFIDKIYCASYAVQREYRDFFKLFSRKLEVTYFGLPKSQIDAEKARRRSFDRTAKSRIIIGCVAFHAPVKGVDILLRAVNVLVERGHDVELLQIGGSQFIHDKHDTKSLHDLAVELGLTDRINWAGIQQNVTDCLLDVDIYCQPSRHEALSFSIMEAMTISLPIVATNVGGIPEVVQNGINGFVFPPDDHVKCADKIEELILKTALRHEMGNRSLEIIDSPIFYTENTIELIQKNYDKG